MLTITASVRALDLAIGVRSGALVQALTGQHIASQAEPAA
jgi:hypothetical protein